MKKKLLLSRRLTFLSLGSIAPILSSAQSTSGSSTYFSNALFITLLVVIIILLALIAVVANVLKNISKSDVILQLIKEDEKKAETKSSEIKTAMVIFFIFISSKEMWAAGSTLADGRVGGIDPLTFYTMIGIIVAEIAVLFALVGVIRRLLKPSVEEEMKKPTLVVIPEKSLLDKLNASVELEKEAEIMMDHDYDGIKELDNNLPPWWKYGFYLTIVFALVYLLHFHVMRTGDLQEAEYKKAMAHADAEVAAYLKKSANNVDESNVKYLNLETDLEAGKQVFTSFCVTCHGKAAEGGIGPNLTDAFWIHKGGIVDIFKSVKYGWPEKGMKSWKEDLSPLQMAQVTSYVYSLKGSNPANAKKAEGELYEELAVTNPIDSTANQMDSTKIQLADSLKKP